MFSMHALGHYQEMVIVYCSNSVCKCSIYYFLNASFSCHCARRISLYSMSKYIMYDGNCKTVDFNEDCWEGGTDAIGGGNRKGGEKWDSRTVQGRHNPKTPKGPFGTALK